MDNKEVTAILEKLKELPAKIQLEEVEKYPVETLEIMAVYLYKEYSRKGYDLTTHFDLLSTVLSERVYKLNADFEWTSENKERFLLMNDRITRAFEKAYNEAISVSDELESRIKNNDDFIKDYEIDIVINLYMGEEFNDDSLKEEFGCVISEPISGFSPIKVSFGYTHKRLLQEKPIYLDTSKNWNREYFGDTFNDHHIGYAMYSLLGTHEWSFTDILNVGLIWANVKVRHQYYEEI